MDKINDTKLLYYYVLFKITIPSSWMHEKSIKKEILHSAMLCQMQTQMKLSEWNFMNCDLWFLTQFLGGSFGFIEKHSNTNLFFCLVALPTRRGEGVVYVLFPVWKLATLFSHSYINYPNCTWSNQMGWRETPLIETGVYALLLCAGNWLELKITEKQHLPVLFLARSWVRGQEAIRVINEPKLMIAGLMFAV